MGNRNRKYNTTTDTRRREHPHAAAWYCPFGKGFHFPPESKVHFSRGGGQRCDRLFKRFQIDFKLTFLFRTGVQYVAPTAVCGDLVKFGSAVGAYTPAHVRFRLNHIGDTGPLSGRTPLFDASAIVCV